MKPCKSCNRTEPTVTFSPIMSEKNGKGYPSGKNYVTCDACRAAKQAELRVCTKCELPKPMSDYYVKGGTPGRLQAKCKDCFNEDKRAKRARDNSVVEPVAPDDVTDDPFHWRTYVQPVPCQIYLRN